MNTIIYQLSYQLNGFNCKSYFNDREEAQKMAVNYKQSYVEPYIIITDTNYYPLWDGANWGEICWYNVIKKSGTLTDLIRTSLAGYAKSAWKSGVMDYVDDLLSDFEEYLECNEIPQSKEKVEKILLNGANNWTTYSYGGCSLIYDGDIAKRLCCPSILAVKKGGELPPNSRETWLDVQARALRQACYLIKNYMEVIKNEKI